MATRQVTVGSSVGLHARPAALLSRMVQERGIPVTIGRVGEAGVNAGSVLMVMGLGVEHGETIELTAEGDGADEALEELAGLVGRDLDAE